MYILAIETSCDETAISIVKSNTKGTECTVLSHTVLSQIDIHKEYGGVYPNLAKREHARVIVGLLEKCLRDAGLYKELSKTAPLPKSLVTKVHTILGREEGVAGELITLFEKIKLPKIDAIAVTSGPGLEPALWVGINTALSLRAITSLPVYPINHMEGHIIAATLETKNTADGKLVYKLPKIKSPSLALLISGGHTEIVHIKAPGKYKIIGQTRDDAVGEAFDKVARMMGLEYPGGPVISRLADKARKRGDKIAQEMLLPRPMLHSKDFDFSFSGLKTAVLYKLQKYGEITEHIRELISLDFENAATEVLVKKTLAAVQKVGALEVIVGGGVSANSHIRSELAKALQGKAVLRIPSRDLSTDNALMIAVTAVVHLASGSKPKTKIVANGSWHL
jgi:N6-L-threonylcarbamoyladenine synthase